MAARCNEFFELRQQAQYWRTMHARAAQRASVCRRKAAQLEGIVQALKAALAQSAEDHEVLKARIAWLERQVFGIKGEQTKDSGARPGEGGPSDGAPSTTAAQGAGRRRGQQPGRRSAGRQRHAELPAEEIVHDLGELERCCPKCGLPFDDFPGTEDSEEIHWEVRVVRRVHRRKRYRPTCKCPGVPGIITAPLP